MVFIWSIRWILAEKAMWCPDLVIPAHEYFKTSRCNLIGTFNIEYKCFFLLPPYEVLWAIFLSRPENSLPTSHSGHISYFNVSLLWLYLPVCKGLMATPDSKCVFMCKCVAMTVSEKEMMYTKINFVFFSALHLQPFLAAMCSAFYLVSSQRKAEANLSSVV